jgi:phospholipase A-2-activating protein
MEKNNFQQNLNTNMNDDLFKLSYEVYHHTKAIRTLSVNKRGILVTGSIDGTCAIFEKKEPEFHYTLLNSTKLHTDGVYIVRSSIDDNFFFTGGKDAIVNMMDNQGNPLKEFIGHTKIVNSISQAECDTFISGSWDGTAIVWDIETSKDILQLTGHSYAVTTLALPNKKFITASQDKAIKFWDGGKLYKTVEAAHEDIIRCIILDEDRNSFYTCSNDTVIKQWTMDGRMIGVLENHESFLFTILKKNGILFSGGDEKIVKYWQGSKVLGELFHPNTIWDMACDENNDLITGNFNTLYYFLYL